MGLDRCAEIRLLPASQAAGLTPGLNVPIPTPPTTAGPGSAADVW